MRRGSMREAGPPLFSPIDAEIKFRHFFLTLLRLLPWVFVVTLVLGNLLLTPEQPRRKTTRPGYFFVKQQQ